MEEDEEEGEETVVDIIEEQKVISCKLFVFRLSLHAFGCFY